MVILKRIRVPNGFDHEIKPCSMTVPHSTFLSFREVKFRPFSINKIKKLIFIIYISGSPVFSEVSFCELLKAS